MTKRRLDRCCSATRSAPAVSAASPGRFGGDCRRSAWKEMSRWCPASGTAPYALLDGSGDIVTTRLDDLLGPRMSSSQPANRVKPHDLSRLKPINLQKLLQ